MTESSGPAHDPIEEQLILAREVGRGIQPPAFDGFAVELQGQRVNLWWYDRHLRSRAFSDAFVTRRNQLVLVVASVSDPLDPTGLALSIRAFLRARLWANTENPNMMAELEHWAEEDPQWTGCCELAMAILEPNHVLRCARYGLMSLVHRGVDGHFREVDFPDAPPLLLGASLERRPVPYRRLILGPGEAFAISTADASAAVEGDPGSSHSGAWACVTADRQVVTDNDESPVQQEIDRCCEELRSPIRRQVELSFDRAIAVLLERARKSGDESEIDRLISHGPAIRQQWIPLAIREELNTAWMDGLNADWRKFIDRLHLFVFRGIEQRSPERWQKVAAHHIRLVRLADRIGEWEDVGREEVHPLLTRAGRDDPKPGQFAPLDEQTYRHLDGMYEKLETAIREFHALLIDGLAMQGEWMDEWGYKEIENDAITDESPSSP